MPAGRAIRMWIEEPDPFATAKPDARLVKLLIRARRFNATLLGSDGVPFAAPVRPRFANHLAATAVLE